MSSRGMIAARQRVNAYRPNYEVPARVQASLLRCEDGWEEGRVMIRTAGRRIFINGLEIPKGAKMVVVAAKWRGCWYCCHNHQWSTNDPATLAKCRQLVLKFAA